MVFTAFIPHFLVGECAESLGVTGCCKGGQDPAVLGTL